MKKITMQQFMDGVYQLEAQNPLRCTLLGIGPMSENLIEATFTLAKRKDFPIMFIASRNQVDANELGGGYVCGWNQQTFRKDIDTIAIQCGFQGLYYLCRDHGGPWQRDKERNDRLDPQTAMMLAKKSYLYDLQAGFDLLHVDPTKIPTIDGIPPIELVLDYTVELIAYCEEQRQQMRLPPVAYEVGTEETNGGLTGIEEYEKFIAMLVARLHEQQLPLPLFIVGQTGTLTRLTENIGHFNPTQARQLSRAARVHGVGLKEHNGDYLSDFILGMHPALGITATNVAPEYGVVETRALLNLFALEQFFFQNGTIDACSQFGAVFARTAIEGQRWKKWMTPEKTAYTAEQILADEALCHEVLEICGHYTFNDSTVKSEIAIMYTHLESCGLRPHRIVVNAILKSIERYVDFFNLEGLTTRVMETL